MIKIENILFWILIALIVGIAVWKLFGSPTDTATLIAIALFVSTSEILLWKALFSMDKKVTVGFVRIKSDTNNLKGNFVQLNKKLDKIEELIKNKK